MCMLRQGCSVNMLHGICEKCMGMLGRVDWACPISCICLFILSLWGVKKYSIPYIKNNIKSQVVNSNVYQSNQVKNQYTLE